MDNTELKPETLFKLAEQNPVISNYLYLWRQGELTLENSLIGMVIGLYKQNVLLFKQVEDTLNKQPQTIKVENLDTLKGFKPYLDWQDPNISKPEENRTVLVDAGTYFEVGEYNYDYSVWWESQEYQQINCKRWAYIPD